MLLGIDIAHNSDTFSYRRKVIEVYVDFVIMQTSWYESIIYVGGFVII